MSESESEYSGTCRLQVCFTGDGTEYDMCITIFGIKYKIYINHLSMLYKQCCVMLYILID